MKREQEQQKVHYFTDLIKHDTNPLIPIALFCIVRLNSYRAIWVCAYKGRLFRVLIEVKQRMTAMKMISIFNGDTMHGKRL